MSMPTKSSVAIVFETLTYRKNSKVKRSIASVGIVLALNYNRKSWLKTCKFYIDECFPSVKLQYK